MFKSIRGFLLLNLLITIILVSGLSALGDYYLSEKLVRKHMDAMLTQMGYSFAALISHNLNKDNLALMETDLSLIQQQKHYFYYLSDNPIRIDTEKKRLYYFQLSDKNNHLLLHSRGADQLDFKQAKPGLENFHTFDQKWRVFKLTDQQNGLTFIVAEPYNVRDQLLKDIALNNLYLMLFVIPLATLFIWLILGRGFSRLAEITNEVSNRAPSYLEPVDLEGVPQEITPLINAINKLFIRLHEAFQREKRFTADAAHELRTPLAALKTQAQVALKTQNAEERQLVLENLVHSVDRMVHVVQQLLTLSRLVPEAVSIYEMVKVNLSKLAPEIIAQLVPMAIDKNIEIGLEAPEEAIYIQGNLTGISILIRNLVDNALRYTPPNGQVTVELKQTENAIVLTVTDTGPGIAEELRARVFERFFRIIGATASGSGLGLAIVKQIADLHQAKISLHTPETHNGLKIVVSFSKNNNFSE